MGKESKLWLHTCSPSSGQKIMNSCLALAIKQVQESLELHVKEKMAGEGTGGDGWREVVIRKYKLKQSCGNTSHLLEGLLTVVERQTLKTMHRKLNSYIVGRNKRIDKPLWKMV